MAVAIFAAFFRENDLGKTGLSPTITVEEFPVASGSPTKVVDAGAMSESANIDGLYWYRTADIIDLKANVYIAAATAAGSVDVATVTAELLDVTTVIKGAVEYTYTIDDGSVPIEGAEVWLSTDAAGNNVIWSGVTDALGVARAVGNNEKPWLDAGTYYGWVQKTGYSFANPDTLTVS
jgi:hypothetical protein